MIRTTLQFALRLILSPLLVAQQVASAALDGVTSGADVAKSSAPATLTRKTVIPLILLDSVSSENAQKGDKVRVAVAEDVRVNGAVLIPEGTLGSGLVTHARKAILGKRDGNVEIRPVSIMAPNGKEVALQEYVDRSGDGCDGFKDCAALPLLLVIAIPITIGLGIGYLVSPHNKKVDGYDRTIKACSRLWASPAHNVLISPMVANSTQSATEFACPTRNSDR